MTGTDEAAAATAEAETAATADEALYVLTAVLLTPAQFPSVLGDDFPEACAALGLEPYAGGYGMVLGQDGAGARWTVVVDDVSLVAVAIASWDCGMEYDLSPDERTVVAALPGWPLELAVAAPGVAPPHDPEPEPDEDGTVRPPLTPPDTSMWGAPQRRLGADEVALQWAMWREQISDGDEDEAASPGGEAEEDQTDAEVRRPDDDTPTVAPDDDDSEGTPDSAADDLNARVEQVLAEVREYLDSPPPLGRVRSSFAPGGARMLRADGPGWSMVARTDDIAFILLDDEPGQLVPVGRGPKLPGLLEALDAMAVRPS
ncbi:hypothetical protein [Streptomyces sp. CBMA152]|uniref:hypothetical protein n=1 Tax=Streptomyces sp. CBMA152 TaxID=1896312 RepID=UPI001660C216|nr:hypothetical protein [Streptomyces sp. CBMA152]MBD0740893.1 hypothetical protein [Streptomyces sp. CBMA152]